MLNFIIVRYLGLQPYEKILNAMNFFVDHRTSSDFDEIWLVQHPHVFTQGKNQKFNFPKVFNTIPIVQSNRGGGITYHGPGQQIIYILLNLRNQIFKISNLIVLLENIIITTLSYFSISSYSIINSPGVYVNKKKICSLGLRISNKYLSHGLSLNVNMDLTPFSYIDPCGYSGLRMTQMSNHSVVTEEKEVIPILLENLSRFLHVKCSDIKSWKEKKYKI
ncbi:Octanoyltransferase [Candidatus Westeberhardia cardiocondylae]|uniref:Octanoyltransferase n=1 Tax=Candidatus Westeberhardia cardiocondylae TaxID=1594731 RepID=A0A0H5BWV5_9ENTR|nr:lipoyl(octanoyl) transferase LipB [Candidatus Westeberhardia cardiocondylae]MCR3756467.1 lipoyl(octanoyl) transferase [Candidatus Westeberhardia cardiocondylae]CEN32168.1 Octanoyltransferase [Candidatus Westeberhardia cardiocondylae]